MTRRRSAALAAFIVLATLSSGCSATAKSQPGGLLAAMRAAGYARVPLAQTPPYTAVSPSGVASGYLVDVTKLVLGKLGIPNLRATVTTYDAMIPALQAGRYDLLPGALNITEARCKTILFSEPVTVQHDALAVKAGNPRKLLTYKDVANNPSIKLGVLSGSSQQSFALAQGVRANQILAVPDAQTGISAVTDGRVDAFVAGQFTLTAQKKNANAAFDIEVDTSSALSGVGVGFRMKDRSARDEFDRILAQLRTDGRLQKLYADAGFTNADLLATTTRADIAPDCG